MTSSLILFTFIGYLLLLVTSLSWMQHVMISRSSIRSDLNVVTISPKNWIAKSSFGLSQNNLFKRRRIKEIVYMPSYVNINVCDGPEKALDDEHFCSILSDSGYIIHVVHTTRPNDAQNDVYNDLFNWFKQKSGKISSPFAIIAHELSSPKLLDHLTKRLLLSTEVDEGLNCIGAVIVIDCPSLNLLHDKIGRKSVLQRYSKSYESMEYFKQNIQMPLLSQTVLERKWKAYRDIINNNLSLRRYLLDNSIVQDEHDANSSYSDNKIDKDLELELKLFKEYQDSMTLKGIDVDKESFFASLPKQKRKRLMTSMKTSKTKKNNNQLMNLLPSNDDSIVNDMTLIGPTPTRGYDVGEAMPHRILFLSSFLENKYLQSPSNIFSIDYDQNNESNRLFMEMDELSVDDSYLSDEAWSFRSSQEMSQLYGAGDAISIHPRHIEEDDDDDNNNSDYLDLSLTESTEDDVEDNIDEDSDDIWTKEDIIKHRRIAYVISDWLRMLGICGYLPQ